MKYEYREEVYKERKEGNKEEERMREIQFHLV